MKKVGQVTPEERDTIRKLYERRNGLTELAKILTADNSDLYEKMVTDLGATISEFQAWWDNTSAKYRWESCQGGNWQINFETCDIYLVEP